MLLDTQKKNNNHIYFIILIIASIFYILAQEIFLRKVSQVDYFSMASEGVGIIIIGYFIYEIERFRDQEMFIYLISGALFLYISLLTDIFDETYHHPVWLTTIFENIFQMIGYIIFSMGIIKWLNLNQQQKDELQDLARTDNLLGLFNRDYFLAFATNEIKKKKRSDKEIFIFLIDIDHFKKINDTFGHFAGDEVLRAFAKNLKSNLRDFDIIARWGGEEFIGMLLTEDANYFQYIIERLRKSTQELCVIYDGEIINFSISIGCSFVKKEDKSIHETIKRADLALYKAKQSGRNQVCFASI